MEDEVLKDILNENDYIVPYLKQFFKYLSGNKILDLGCKKGYNTRKIHNLGYQSIGYDEDSQNIDYAKKNNPEITFINDSYDNINKLDKVDGILLFLTLNEISYDKINEFIKNLTLISNEETHILIVLKNQEMENMYYYSKEHLDILLKNNFDFIEELSSYDNWKFYIYKKNTVK